MSTAEIPRRYGALTPFNRTIFHAAILGIFFYTNSIWGQLGLPFSMVAGSGSATPTPSPSGSPTATATTTPPAGTVFTPVISPSSGDTPTSVSITEATAGSTIFYTLSAGGTAPSHSGSTPLGSTRVYSGTFSTGSGTQKVVEAIGYKSGMTDSAIATATYQGGGGQ